MKTLFLALALITISAQAAELRYATYPRFSAHAAHGAFVVWSEEGDLRIARADLRGDVAETIRFDVLNVNLDHPAIAGNGASTLVAFVHTNGLGLQQTAGVTLDPNGKPSVFRLYGPSNGVTPFVAWNGSAFVVRSGASVFTVDRDGTLLATSNEPAFEPFVANEQARLTYSAFSFQGGRHCGFSMCTVLPPWYSVYWGYTSNGDTKRGTETRSWYGTAQPVAATSGSDFVVAWQSATGLEALRIAHGSPVALTTIPSLGDAALPPALASDGARYLLVWTALGDIHGAWVGENGVALPFAITATTTQEESHPVVSAIARGRFLVTYKSGDALVGQLVRSPDAPTRRRAVN